MIDPEDLISAVERLTPEQIDRLTTAVSHLAHGVREKMEPDLIAAVDAVIAAYNGSGDMKTALDELEKMRNG